MLKRHKKILEAMHEPEKKKSKVPPKRRAQAPKPREWMLSFTNGDFNGLAYIGGLHHMKSPEHETVIVREVPIPPKRKAGRLPPF